MTLDELVLEWSYRTQKGYPDMDDPSDVFILRQLQVQAIQPQVNINHYCLYLEQHNKEI